MALDSIVSLLSKAMNEDWESIDPATLDEEEQNYLTAYLVERSHDEYLLTLMPSPYLMIRHLDLDYGSRLIVNASTVIVKQLLETGFKKSKGWLTLYGRLKDKELVDHLFDIRDGVALNNRLSQYIALDLPVSFQNFCRRYDENGMRKKRRLTSKQFLGINLEQRFRKSRGAGQSFEEWVQDKVDPVLFEKMVHSRFYAINILSLDGIIERYLTAGVDCSIGSFCNRYDVFSGKPVVTKSNGHVRRTGKTHGSKYFQRYIVEKGTHCNFESWIEEHVSREVFSLLMNSPFYKKSFVPLEQVVESYISAGLNVSFSRFCVKYDVLTGSDVMDKKDERKSTPQGEMYYCRYLRERKEEGESSFESWVERDVPSELFARLMSTEYYRNALTLPEMVEQYIEHNPQTSLTNFFVSFDANTGKQIVTKKNGTVIRQGSPQGNKYYIRFCHVKKTNGTLRFDDWVIGEIPPYVTERLMQCDYFRRNHGT